MKRPPSSSWLKRGCCWRSEEVMTILGEDDPLKGQVSSRSEKTMKILCGDAPLKEQVSLRSRHQQPAECSASAPN
jgi:hypothetical protein